MESEFILLLFSILAIVFILIVILLMIIWLLIHKKALKEMTEALKRPPSVAEKRQKSDGIEEVPEEPDMTSMASLRSAQSVEDIEKLMPQTLMTWNSDEDSDNQTSVRSLNLGDEKQSINKDQDSKLSSIEIRKIESDNYIIYMPPFEAKEGKEADPAANTAPEVVAFEENPQIGPDVPPDDDNEFTLETL